jgi:hypothetical protein
MSNPGSEVHRIKFARRGEATACEYSPEEFHQVTGVQYLPQLIFENEKTHERVRAQCRSTVRSGLITSEMKWLGALDAQRIQRHFIANVSIRWIDEIRGHGLFAEQALAAGDYVGEYTGIVRKRMIFSLNHNDYCFSYPTSEVGFRRHMIDALKNGNELRYANHSRKPGMEPRCVLVDGVLHVIFEAIQNLPAGSELTFNYHHNYWKTRTHP